MRGDKRAYRQHVREHLGQPGENDEPSAPRLQRVMLLAAAAAGAAYALLIAAGAVARTLGGGPSPWQLALGGIIGAGLAGLLWFSRPPPLAASAAGEAPADAAASSGTRAIGPLVEVLLLGLLAAAIGCLGSLHLDRFPGLRGDETVFLQFSANYARADFLAQRVGEELAPELWMTSTGPFVLLPAGALMKRVGVSLGAARAVTGFYFLLTAAACYLGVRWVSGPGAALVALLGLGALPESINTARMMMGDFAAVGLVVAGAHLWLAALEQRTGRRGRSLLAAAALALGLLVVTKLVFALVACGFLAYALADRGLERRVRLSHVALPVIAVLALVVPWELHAHSAGGLSLSERSATRGAGLDYLTPEPSRLIEKAREAAARPEFALALAGVFLGLARGGRAARQSLLLALIGLLWLGWWLSFRLVLHRYLILPSVLSVLIAAPLAAAAGRALREGAGRPVVRALAIAVLIVGVLLPAGRLASNVWKVLTAPAGPITEERVAGRLRELTGGGTRLDANLVPLGVLFFDDRPIRPIPFEAAAAQLEPAPYLWVGDVAPVSPPAAFELAWRDGAYSLYVRR